MVNKYIICAFLVLTVCIIHPTYGKPSRLNKPEPKLISNIIIDAIKNQIKKLITLVESIVHTAIDDLVAIEHKIADITEGAIKLATDAINDIIDGAIDSVRQIAEDAIDAGINITECYVKSIDELNIIRRQLLADEILCASNQLTDFNLIINSAVNNFTDDLNLIGGLPKRLQGCLTSLNVIQCVTELVTDVTKLQQDIPQQILGTMLAITDYMTGFDIRVHKCQFDELNEAIDQSRNIIEDVRYCAKENEEATTYNAS